jgi:hypothetical protein
MKRYSLSALLVIILLGQTADGNVAEVTVNGGLTTGVDIYDREDKNPPATRDEQGAAASSPIAEDDGDEDDYQRVLFQPLISIDRIAERSTLNLTYQPGFYYDFLNEEDGIDHRASLSFLNQVTKDWKLSLVDSFLHADNAERSAVSDSLAGPAASGETVTDVTVSEGGGDQVSNDEGRRKYTTNSLQLLSDYGYREDSVFSLGYNYGILRNDDDDGDQFQDFDRHEARASLDHRLNSDWKTSLALGYVRGLFDEPSRDDTGTAAASDPIDEEPSDDVNEYHADAGITYEGIDHNPLSLDYGLAVYDFDDDAQSDSEIHDLTFGWIWQRSQHITYNAAAGPSYAKTDGQDDTWGYNGELGADYAMEHGRFRLSVEKGLERRNFTGEVDENGLIDFWEGRADYSYRLLESTTLSLFAGYRDEDQDEVSQINTALSSPADSSQQIEDNLLETVTTQRFYTGGSVKYYSGSGTRSTSATGMPTRPPMIRKTNMMNIGFC